MVITLEAGSKTAQEGKVPEDRDNWQVKVAQLEGLDETETGITMVLFVSPMLNLISVTA